MRNRATWKRTGGVLVTLGLMLLMPACGHDSRIAPVALPADVPKAPVFAFARDVQARLADKGMDCTNTAGDNSADDHGSTATCVSTVDGDKVLNEISVFAHPQPDRSDIGTSVALRRKSPTFQTLVAAGNWYVWVRPPTHAQAIATALGGVVLPAIGASAPAYPLPTIPAAPRYPTVEALAHDLDQAVGCTGQKVDDLGVLTCDTGGAVGRSPNCATLALYGTAAARDQALRDAIRWKGVPAYLVTAANWTVNLCDYDLADAVATALQGVVVGYDGS
ncbi:hypothetical protein RVR_1172 [Actinacidiphila reveromycinica]|uniref:Lipoprotein n=1 Tax=Actinacidiphila reveromycinica TaxID=659352 RepID=A0A7U3UP09_9ACTN|nr:hypothetical protein [Streptomyces sp. SN-593]BBA96046.1 hypothetical protein RVR_1172 [Streptomyces sp. SN-593]